MENNKSTLKPWVANLIVWAIELIIIVAYFYIGLNSIGNISSLSDIAGLFDDVITAIIFLEVAILSLAICCLAIKPLRTKNNKSMAIWNIIWAVMNLYLMFS